MALQASALYLRAKEPPPQDPTPLGEAAHEGGGSSCRPIGRSCCCCGGGGRHLRGRSTAVSPTQSSIGHHSRRLRGLQGEEGRHARAGSIWEFAPEDILGYDRICKDKLGY